jgi:hypothetical protein
MALSSWVVEYAAERGRKSNEFSWVANLKYRCGAAKS